MKKKSEVLGGGVSAGSFEIEIYHEHMESKVKVALLEQSIGQINQTLSRIENRMDTRFDKVDKQFDKFRHEVKNDFRWIIGLMVAFSSGILGVMAHGFHWF